MLLDLSVHRVYITYMNTTATPDFITVTAAACRTAQAAQAAKFNPAAIEAWEAAQAAEAQIRQAYRGWKA